MGLTFQSWLSDQDHRQDAVGQLARYLGDRGDNYLPGRRKMDEHKKWADIISWQGKPEYVISFNQAWREYQASKDKQN
jgi:hypothetical protein